MTAERDSRPKPQYGEYADPNSEPQAQKIDEAQGVDEAPGDATVAAENAGDQKPSFGVAAQDWARGEDQPQTGIDSAQGSTEQAAVTPAPSAAPGQQVASPRANVAGPIPGVPHNLGATGSKAVHQHAPSQLAVDSTRVDPASSATNAPYTPTPASQDPSANAAVSGTAKARPRGADRIVTIILLAVGSYFALSMALTLSQFTLEFSRVADQLGVKEFTAPPMLKTLGTVGAILVLAIYALVLIFSIRRLRAQKVTFWAPLVAGVLAWVLFFVLFFIGLNQSAELWQALLNMAADPAAAQQMLERLNSNS